MIKSVIRKELKTYNAHMIKKTTENNINTKVLRSKRSNGKSLVYKINNEKREDVIDNGYKIPVI